MKLVSRASRPGLTVSYAYFVMGCALLKDFSLKSMIIRAVLDAQVNPTLSLSLSLQRLPSFVQHVTIFLATSYCIVTEKSFTTRL